MCSTFGMSLKHLQNLCFTGKSIMASISKYSTKAMRTEQLLLSVGTKGNVFYEKDDNTGIAKITLSNPEIRNALSGSMMIELKEIVRDLEEWKEGRICILQGEGGNFCSGGDLNLIKKLADYEDGGERMCAYMHDVVRRMRKLPLLSIAYINGLALGGGAELTLACDLRVASDRAKIGFVQGVMGLTPGWGAADRLIQVLGYQRSLEVLLAARILETDRALGLKLIDHVATTDDEFQEYLKQYLDNRINVQVFREMKTLLYNLNEQTLNYQLQRESFKNVWGGEALMKAIATRPKHK
ncbi:DgyrCDS2762 [Dimorphilus gyrociliatus]|uniref:Ethylmalonyl-CoA decarboxylase n=1 Tax=Dimorphilus gyrociliatus TaxID=2664684 RepID=A0A7I8VDZ4_9ANNE|nr:DgyrCDS2762 [Dimorphilus gyrociliatus]